MASTDKYQVCAVTIGATTIGQITSSDVSQEIQELLAADSAGLYNRAVAVALTRLRISVSTQAVKTALTALGTTGVDLSASTAVVYFAKKAQGGSLAAAGCVTITIAAGLAVWRGVQASLDSAAVASFDIVGISADGSAAPAVLATGIALPTVATEELYGVGGSTGVQSLDIDSGLNVAASHGDDDVYETFASVALPIQPRISYVQTEMGAIGPAAAAGSVSIVEYSPGGGRGDSITFTWTEGVVHSSAISPDTTQTVIPSYDGSNAPIVISGLT